MLPGQLSVITYFLLFLPLSWSWLAFGVLKDKLITPECMTFLDDADDMVLRSCTWQSSLLHSSHLIISACPFISFLFLVILVIFILLVVFLYWFYPPSAYLKPRLCLSGWKWIHVSARWCGARSGSGIARCGRRIEVWCCVIARYIARKSDLIA